MLQNNVYVFDKCFHCTLLHCQKKRLLQIKSLQTQILTQTQNENRFLIGFFISTILLFRLPCIYACIANSLDVIHMNFQIRKVINHNILNNMCNITYMAFHKHSLWTLNSRHRSICHSTWGRPPHRIQHQHHWAHLKLLVDIM